MHNSTKKSRLFKHLNIYLVLIVVIVIQLAYKSKGPLDFRRKNCQRLNRYNFGIKKFRRKSSVQKILPLPEIENFAANATVCVAIKTRRSYHLYVDKFDAYKYLARSRRIEKLAWRKRKRERERERKRELVFVQRVHVSSIRRWNTATP